MFSESQMSNYDEEAINAALQRLAMRQQQRQYKSSNIRGPQGGAAEKTSNDLSSKHIATRQRTQSWGGGSTKDSFSSTSSLQTAVESCSSGKRKDSEQEGSQNNLRSDSRNSIANRPNSCKNRTANNTFDSFVENAYYENDAAVAYNQVTGVRPVSSEYQPSKGSQQYQLALKQQQKEQLKDDSRTLLEQSKAKHQAMVAQAYAAHKSSYHERNGNVDEAEGKVMMPKPPPKPAEGKKPASAHRLAR